VEHRSPERKILSRRPERDLAEPMRAKVQQTTSDKAAFCA
jgi:hypothetical protein